MLRKIMVWLMGVLGLLCLLYFAILLLKKVDFCGIWAVMGGLCFAIGIYQQYMIRHPAGCRFVHIMGMAAGILLLAAAICFVWVETCIIRTMLEEPEKNLDYVIVLGAQVKKTVPSKALRLRLEKAMEYLEENPDTKAVLSGGQGDGEEISEAFCMYQYLTEHGIHKDRLLMEDRSTSTEENLRYSACIIEEDLRKESKTGTMVMKDPIGLISNNFHMYRAKLYAEKMGYCHVYTVSARSDWKLQIHYLVREFFALLKGKLKGSC